ncbi:hypothetical protein A2716_03140 [candidate division WWE3 bacterium RIFCSPHIGHO2_01_FULL_40_23]|uniref:Solute-binding protein family 5 domain-containing protein n=1 Tax=candidate division WWE3 bacterium RIFCSPLOWO2_01_FULL_41_18 TaxID=1802625 RepID=A0A1F4VD40_UNCKA|nr:MAG: hypothetical protein A2716_03140 [candidate division WWE3 bacterium RIFCSPHIGHO2_01_FULL_40_23]OGC54880.1 MAG: hypothetical protein A3A78_02750 [candidate division WWE3 bacterium RIFCSPLOWO2_01_FULL_41_18]
MNILRNILMFITSIVLTLVPQKTYTEGLIGQPSSFLPNEAVTENDKTVSKLLFRGLYTYNKEGKLVEDLADSYDISDDGLSYTVYLKKGQKWSNSAEITADDLLFSAFTSEQLKEVATDKIDKYTIRYTLPNKFSPFLSLLTMGVSPQVNVNSKVQPISSGPYKVLRLKKDGPVIREVILQKLNGSYNINNITFRYYENYNQLFTAGKLGEVTGFISPEELSWPSFTKKTYFQGGIYYSLIFNLRNSKLNNLDIRKKLLAGTPIEYLAEKRGVRVSGPISESIFTKDDIKKQTYDPNISDNLNLDLTLTLPDTKEHIECGEDLKEAWKKLGVNLTLKPVKSDVIESEVLEKRDFEILLYGQEVSRDPDRYVLWHSTRVNYPGLNISGFENIRLDRSLEEGRKALSEEERMKHYNIFQEVINENVPSIYLYHPFMKYYISEKVKTTEGANIYYIHDRFVDFRNWDIL